MKLYDMRVMFEDGKEGNIKLESNIMPENMQAGSETALQALYYHFPELPIKEVLAVSYDGISLNPETYVTEPSALRFPVTLLTEMAFSGAS